MYKIDVENDFEKAKKIIDREESENLYSKIYYKSNEHLKELLKNFYLDNKSILTVLGSGDQAFHFLNSGVQSVDTFDINRLSIYYFYLRIWIIKYLNRFYPESFGRLSWEKLKKRITITSEKEKEVQQFWNLYFERYDRINSIIEYDPYAYTNEIDNLEILNKRLKNININFYNIDIASNEIKINKKYDVIYTSNISDWLFYKFPNNDYFINYRNNLKKLLKEHGFIICAYAYLYSGNEYEEYIFEQDFKKYKLNKININDNFVTPGYYYVKK